MTDTQLHYLEQLFCGLDEDYRPFVITELEADLTAEQVQDSLGMATSSFSIVSDMDKRFIDYSVSKGGDMSTYQKANFDFIYLKELYSQLGTFAAMLFIASLELNFTRAMLDDFKKKADTKNQQALEIDRLLAEAREANR